MRRSLPILILALVACRRESVAVFRGAPVVLISVDTLRSDHLPAYGYRGVQTPNIDALRRDSILFQRAYSHCPMTLPMSGVAVGDPAREAPAAVRTAARHRPSALHRLHRFAAVSLDGART